MCEPFYLLAKAIRVQSFQRPDDLCVKLAAASSSAMSTTSGHVAQELVKLLDGASTMSGEAGTKAAAWPPACEALAGWIEAPRRRER